MKHFIIGIGWLVPLALVFTAACSRNVFPDPPLAKISSHPDTLFGDIRKDNYHWLKNRTDPEVLQYLEAENRYTNAIMKHTEGLQEKLYEEMLGRIKETDLSVPVKDDGYFYYSRTEKGKQYRIRCRKQGSLDASEEILLDENVLAGQHDYFRVGAFVISPEHRLLAYSTDMEGSELYTLRVKNLATGELFDDVISNTSYDVEWGNDGKTVFYTVQDGTRRPYKVFRHVLGSPPPDDGLVYHEADPAYYLSLSKTKDEKFIVITSGSQTTTEVRFLNADIPGGQWKIIHPRQHEMEYYIEHHGDRFFIRTNDGAKNFKIMWAPDGNPSKKNWAEFVPHRERVKIDGMDVFTDHLVLYEREGGLTQIRVTDLGTNETHYLDFPEPVYTVRRGDNREFDTHFLRFNYTSLITPRSVFDYDMITKKRELKKRDEVLGGYDPAQYESERIFAKARDGTEIPISLMVKKGFPRDGSHPLLLYGYGAYGASIDPVFSSNRLSLVDRGFAYAIAHVRGGGEMGREWYEDGKMLNKRKSFTDFIASAEHLISERYTSPDKLAIRGGSAGGLLIGAVTNMRPDLFKAVVANVPFVDVLNTMLDPDIPLTVIEYEEWGNPNEKEYYDTIKSYSPYDNVQSKDYPNMLITAGLNDPRVQVWEPAKWTARLRALKTDDNILLLKTEMGAGHFGPSGRYDYLRKMAFRYAFILDVLGMTE